MLAPSSCILEEFERNMFATLHVVRRSGDKPPKRKRKFRSYAVGWIWLISTSARERGPFCCSSPTVRYLLRFRTSL